jgi:hypothetical protein
VPRQRKSAVREPERFGSRLGDEAAAVLECNPDATDSEVCAAVNCWWMRIDEEGDLLTVIEVADIRASCGIPKTRRKPHQRNLFD